jgi:hypothetical protein
VYQLPSLYFLFSIPSLHPSSCLPSFLHYGYVAPSRRTDCLGAVDTARNRSHLVTRKPGPGSFDILKQAIQNILTTDVAEFTYAQIIDGLPTTSSFRDFHILRRSSDHPVQYHPTLCEGTMDRVRDFRSKFDCLSLKFEPHVRDIRPLVEPLV